MEKRRKFKLLVSHPERATAERCRRSFPYFIRTFWDEVSPDALKWNWHIDVLCEELTGLAERVAKGLPKKHDLVINVPPGTTKSITCSIMFPVWCWTRWEWMRFITCSYSGALSLEHAEYSRELVRSDTFQKLFPDLSIKYDKDTKSNFRIQRKTLDENGQEKIIIGGNRYSTSVGGTLTGFHGHVLIVDDPLDPQRAVSDVEVKKANRWIEQTLSTRKVNKAVTPTILIMQRLHQNDPSGHLLAKEKKNLRHVCLPGEIRHYREEVKPTHLVERYVDDLLDPVRMDWDVLEEMEQDLGQYGYAGQVGQRPTPPGGGMFKVDMFEVVDHILSPPVKTARYWDKAGTQDDGAFSVGVKMSQLRNGKFLIHDVKRGQWSSDIREQHIRSRAEADGRDVTVWIEQEPGSGGKESAESTIKNLAGFVVYADRPTGDKVYRADPYSVQVNSGNVLLLRGDWNRDFIEEHRFFPFSTYKDQVDAAAGAFAKLTSKKKRVGTF